MLEMEFLKIQKPLQLWFMVYMDIKTTASVFMAIKKKSIKNSKNLLIFDPQIKYDYGDCRLAISHKVLLIFARIFFHPPKLGSFSQNI